MTLEMVHKSMPHLSESLSRSEHVLIGIPVPHSVVTIIRHHPLLSVTNPLDESVSPLANISPSEGTTRWRAERAISGTLQRDALLLLYKYNGRKRKIRRSQLNESTVNNTPVPSRV
jgi:hypothetical protein